MNIEDLATRAALKALVLPPGLFVLALVLALLFWRKALGRLLVVLVAAALYLLSTPQASGWLAGGLERYPPLDIEQVNAADANAILVLMGGRYSRAPEYQGRDTVGPSSMARLNYAARVHRQTDLPVIVAGGRAGMTGEPLAQLAAEYLISQFGIQPLALEKDSNTTWENARNSRELLRQLGIARVLVVTHAAHMPRAMLSMEFAGIDAVAAPTRFVHRPGPERWQDWLPERRLAGRQHRPAARISRLAVVSVQLLVTRDPRNPHILWSDQWQTKAITNPLRNCPTRPGTCTGPSPR